ncbi:hypothetical protein Ngar_c16830 [Candidatus Nitrososphaera gargensis Ga9.2]|uniref:Uncharacterized protein n=1 Tax=Nitrososphaera gargensis (strain Ga9.2) TaxID=1237085 RepID=K0IBF0_NITGG|nr:hypothetical protein Ngar_c16830 [Candidatus Nitrososphaera gargensis Ga9.2]
MSLFTFRTRLQIMQQKIPKQKARHHLLLYDVIEISSKFIYNRKRTVRIENIL